MKFQGREVGIPWRRAERRQADVTALALQALQSQASTGGSSATAATEMAAGLLARSLAGAKVSGPGYIRAAVTPGVLAQIGRALILRGESMHMIDVSEAGIVRLFPVASWMFTGSYDQKSWVVDVDLAGPSMTTTRRVGYEGVVHVTWGTNPGSPHAGVSPLKFSAISSKLNSEVERSLADEVSGPIANLLAVPDSASGENADGDPAADPLAALSGDIRNARGRSILVETTSGGWGEGRSAAPRKDFVPSRLGPSPGAALVELRRDAQAAILAACGVSPSIFDPSATGTAQREGLRRTFLNLIQPIARLVQLELSVKLEAEIRLDFDQWAGDLIGRASAFSKLVQSGKSLEEAANLTGLLGSVEAERD